ncbi:MAG TPA: TadE/TadG family type IV pilus assembly protein [Fimbriiglobus sp.]|jgi:Flp pilus assembly protein TadG|nr:TadE/TadG family type IV pilus assembly protein [Fimbriiglobus sp.]
MIHPQLRADRRRGAAVVEAALVIGLLFLVLFGIYEYGRLLMVQNLAEHAAREGAREAVVQFTADRDQDGLDAATDRVRAAVLQAMGSQLPQVDGFRIDVVRADPTTGADAGPWYAARHGEPIAVRVTGTYRPAARFFMPATVPVRVQATMSSEAN